MNTKWTAQTCLKLESDEIEFLASFNELHPYSINSELFYDGQIPVVAYLLHKGRIQFFKGKKIKGSVGEGHIIGARELYHHEPSIVGARVMANSEITFIDRSTLHEILESTYENLIKSIVSSHALVNS